MGKNKVVLRSARDALFIALKEQILVNNLKPDELLQIERLAEEYGVSATPVREALVKLEADGLVTQVLNKGAKVSSISEEDVKNVWEMRRLLESYAARESISLITAEEIDSLEKDILKLRDSEFDNALYMDVDNRLHELFFLHLTNNLLKDSIRSIHELSQRIRYIAETSKQMHEKVIQDVTQEHLSIIISLRSRNAELLVPLLYTHLLNGEKRTLEALRKNQKK
ncbi:GntR family transcriptional regulator [Sphaerochaeta sp.]|jgi:DNA-binding GntR family transcriptional regulator|uniref:GntR family transcriptional regulator n=1 Tax=Sphaerochaeta sp. TaxID=1972642 RepID=UPI002FCC021E